MKLSVLVSLAAAHSASAFQAAQPHLSSKSSSTSLFMSSHHINSDPNALGENRGSEQILSALGTLEGPSYTYGHYAALEGKSPIDIKGYDNFDLFKVRIWCNATLKSCGPFVANGGTSNRNWKPQPIRTTSNTATSNT